GYREPILVSSADGVGTKLMVARRVGDYSTVGHDLVNHCVNDILVQGAEPLFFLDYVGAGILEPKAAVELVSGVAAGCRENGCALLGGETAEMPGFYQPGDYELVGTIVGLVDRPRLLDGGRVRAGDVLIGLPSSGLHTNGYSLARKILFEQLGLTVDDPLPGGEETVGATLLATHRSYLPALRPLLGHGGLHALAHITGGGLTDNVPRILPEGLGAVVDTDRLPRLPIFDVLEERGEVERQEMLRVFNMGAGMVVVAAAEHLDAFLDALRGEDPFVLGRVEAGERGVSYRPGSAP
ncbi:MAG: phosphoribosylformylglycinamidine cyclo-ligase, partial [Acidobacteriota bacterium]